MASWNWSTDVAAELTEFFLGWTNCVETADPIRLAKYLHAEFLYVTVFGLRLTKSGYLDMVAAIAPGAHFTIHRTSARVSGDIAELDGEYEIAGGTTAGEDLSAHTRFTATWLRSAEGWVCLTHHGTHYQPEAR